MSKNTVAVVFFVTIGVVTWKVTSGMNREAIAMAIGVLFGILAGIPLALIVGVSSKKESCNCSQTKVQSPPIIIAQNYVEKQVVIPGAGGISQARVRVKDFEGLGDDDRPYPIIYR